MTNMTTKQRLVLNFFGWMAVVAVCSLMGCADSAPQDSQGRQVAQVGFAPGLTPKQIKAAHEALQMLNSAGNCLLLEPRIEERLDILVTPNQPARWDSAADAARYKEYTVLRMDNTDHMVLFMHEFGHALGLEHSDDPTSFMYFTFMGNQGITSEDTDHLMALCPEIT